MSKELLEFLMGKERYEKEEQFKKSLLEIEEEFIDFFSERKTNHINEKHDRLHDHYLIISDNYSIKFGFENDTDLPREIIDKCMSEFRRIFKDK